MGGRGGRRGRGKGGHNGNRPEDGNSHSGEPEPLPEGGEPEPFPEPHPPDPSVHASTTTTTTQQQGEGEQQQQRFHDGAHDRDGEPSMSLPSVATSGHHPYGSSVVTTVPDAEMGRFVEAETRDLEDNILPASAALERQTAANTESAKRTMIKFDEELEWRRHVQQFREAKEAMDAAELASALEERSRLSSASSTPQKARGTPKQSVATPLSAASTSKDGLAAPLPVPAVVISPDGGDKNAPGERRGSDAAVVLAVSLHENTQEYAGQSSRAPEAQQPTFLTQAEEPRTSEADPPRQPQQQQQQAFYGAAALPVESSSEALEKAAKVTQQGGYGDGEGTLGRDSGSQQSGSGGREEHRTTLNPRVSSLSTRQTNYAAIGPAAPDFEDSEDVGSVSAHRSPQLSQQQQPSSSHIRDLAYRHGSGTARPRSPGQERCRVQEEEVRRMRAFFWPLVVAPPLSHDEQQEEAYYLPFRDTHFYCYSLEEEMPAMQAITVDQAAKAAAEGTLCTPVTRNLPGPPSRYGGVDDASSISSPSPPPQQQPQQQQQRLFSPPPPFSTHDESAHPYHHRDNASFGSGLSLLPGMNVNGAEYADHLFCGGTRHIHRYDVPQMRRVWATTVLRQLLFSSLSSALLVVLFAPTVVCGSLLDVGSMGHADSFFSSSNRFAVSAALSAMGAATGGAAVLLASFVAVAVAGYATRGGTRPGECLSSRDVLFLLSPRVLLLFGVVFGVAGSNLRFYAGTEGGAGVTVAAQMLSGGGGAMTVMGIFAMACAEVGIAAGAVVVLAMVIPAWLAAAAADFLVLPYVLDSWVTSAQVLHGMALLETTTLVFGAALALLLPVDMLTRAAEVNVPYFSPSALRKAAREVSLRFCLRVLSCATLTATLLCLAICATPIMTQRSASGGRVQTELVPVDPRHAVSFMFLVALCVWPFCLVPTSAAWINRYLPNSLLTLLLALLWLAYAMLDPPSTVGGVASAVFPAAPAPVATTTATGADDYTKDGLDMMASLEERAAQSGGKRKGDRGLGSDRSTAPPPVLAPSALSRLAAHVLTPSLCALATGIVFAVVAASVVRSIANAGATLPIHPRRQRTYQSPFRPLPRRGTSGSGGGGKATGSSPAESDGLLPSRLATAASHSPSPPCSPADDGGNNNDGGGNIRARFIFQRRGGPAAVLVLSFLFGVVCVAVCALALAVASALLTDLYHTPRNSLDIADGVQVDMHQSLLWVVAGLTGLAAFFEACVVVMETWANTHRHRMEI